MGTKKAKLRKEALSVGCKSAFLSTVFLVIWSTNKLPLEGKKTSKSIAIGHYCTISLIDVNGSYGKLSRLMIFDHL